MKQLSFKKLFVIGLSLMALFCFAVDKTYSIKFSDAELGRHWQKLNSIKLIADQSNLPHDQVKFIILSIDSLQQSIQTQVASQMQAEKK